MKQLLNKLNIDFKKDNKTSSSIIQNERHTINLTNEPNENKLSKFRSGLLTVDNAGKDIHNKIENPTSSSKSESNSFRKEFSKNKKNDPEVKIISNRETVIKINEEDTNIKKFLNNLEKKIIQTEKDFISIDESIGNVFINKKENILNFKRKYSQRLPKLNNISISPEKTQLKSKLRHKSLININTDKDIISGNQKTNLAKSKLATYLSNNLDLIDLENKSVILNDNNTYDNTGINSRNAKKYFTNKITSNNEIKDAENFLLRNFANKNCDKSLNKSGFKRESVDKINRNYNKEDSLDKLDNNDNKDNIGIKDVNICNIESIESKENSDSFNNFNNIIISSLSDSIVKEHKNHKISAHKKVPLHINSDLDDRASLKNYKNVYDSMDDGEGDNNIEILIQEHYEEDPWVFSKNSKFRSYWSALIFILILYSTTASPYKLAFYNDNNTDVSYLDLSVDLLFVVDIGLNFFTPYYDNDNNLVGNHRMIVNNYITTWLLFDVFSSFPTDLLNIFLNNSIQHSGSNNSYSIEIKKMIRLSRLYRFGKWLKVVRFLKLAQDANSHSAMNFVYSLELNRLLIFVIMLVILVHIASCLWIFISKLDDNVRNWIFYYGYNNYENFDLYIISVYFTFCTVSTIGYGDIVSQSATERVYNNILLVVGVILFSFCLYIILF